jgi:F-type H+-transporting ATPase subunit b
MEINIAEVIAQAIAFSVVFIVLRWKAWGPIQSALQARRDKIKGDFDSIDASKLEIEKLKVQYQELLDKIEDESRAKMNAAIDEGRKIAKEIQEKTRVEAQADFEKNKQNIQIEAAKARIELRRDIANLSVQVAERILKEEMSESKKQDEKVLRIIEELEKSL